jgi:hypothetical protein
MFNMIGKLLLTLLVVALVVVYVRRRHQFRQNQAAKQHIAGNNSAGVPARRSDSGELEQFLNRARNSADTTNSAKAAGTNALAPRIKIILWSALAALLIFGSAGSYLHWLDQQRLVTVLLHRDVSQAPVIYRVAKRDLGLNTFRTEDGTQVTVSANERMEVIGL